MPSLPPSPEKRNELLSATFGRIGQVANSYEINFVESELKEDCCKIYSDIGEYSIKQIDDSWFLNAEYIVTVEWQKNGRHYYQAYFDGKDRIVEFSGH